MRSHPQMSVAAFLLKCHDEAKDVFSDETLSHMDEKAKTTLIETRVKKTELGRRDGVPQFVHFAIHWSGGQENPFVLKELDEFFKYTDGPRDLNASLLHKVNNLDLGPNNGELLRGAIIKLACHPNEKPVSGGDVVSLLSRNNKPHTLTAYANQKQSRAVIAAALLKENADQVAIIKARDTFDQRLLKHILNRSRYYKSMNEICMCFMQSVVDAGGAAEMPPLWQAAGQASAKSAPAPKRGIVELSCSGPALHTITETLKGMDIVIGSHAMHIKSNLQYKVTAIDVDGVTFEAAGFQKSDYEKEKITASHASMKSLFNRFTKPPKEFVHRFVAQFLFRWFPVSFLLVLTV